MAFMERFPSKLAQILVVNGLTQVKAAALIGVDNSQFGKWLKGQGRPTTEVLLRISKSFNVPMDYLADDSQIELATAATLRDGQENVDPRKRIIDEMVNRLGYEESFDRLMEIKWRREMLISALIDSKKDITASRHRLTDQEQERLWLEVDAAMNKARDTLLARGLTDEDINSIIIKVGNASPDDPPFDDSRFEALAETWLDMKRLRRRRMASDAAQ
jgi:transcriptional regulator with XRE-family HTH domain